MSHPVVGLPMGMGSRLSPESFEGTIGDRLSDTKLGEQDGETGWRRGEGNEEYNLGPVDREVPFQDIFIFKKGASGLKSTNTDAGVNL